MLTVMNPPLPGIKAIRPLIGVIDSLSELLNISSHFSCSRRISATSLCGDLGKLECTKLMEQKLDKLAKT